MRVCVAFLPRSSGFNRQRYLRRYYLHWRAFLVYFAADVRLGQPADERHRVFLSGPDIVRFIGVEIGYSPAGCRLCRPAMPPPKIQRCGRARTQVRKPRQTEKSIAPKICG